MQQRGMQPPEDSVLLRAWDAFERGDMVAVRSLSEKLLGDDPVPQEIAAARILSERMALSDRTPRGVAQALIQRSYPPPRVYLFAAVIVALFSALLLFATFAYPH